MGYAVTGPMSAPLPREHSSFVGRVAELAWLAELVAGRHVVSVLGPPGIGKSRLALRYAHQCARGRKFPGGVWHVDAHAVTRASDLATAVAGRLGLDLRATDRRPDELVGLRLAERPPLLLVLDDLDRAVKRAAPAIRGWADAAPNVRFLVTSREPLRLVEEQRMRLGPLAGRTHRDAVRLFCERAAAICAGYRAPRRAGDVVRELVLRLQGNPLAIELAASQLSVLSEREILEQLPRLLARREGVGAQRNALHDAIARSWALLDGLERRTLAAFCVFSGGFTQEAADAVAGSITRHRPGHAAVHALCEKSLVFAETDANSGTTRYGVSPSVGEFARARLKSLGLAEDAERRHAAHYVAAAERWAAAIDDSATVRSEAFASLTRERQNLEAVAARGARSDAPAETRTHALRALVALGPVILATGPLAPYVTAITLAIGRVPARGSGPIVARATLVRGKARVLAGDAEGTLDLERARALARRVQDRRVEGIALVALSGAYRRAGRLDLAWRCGEEAAKVLGRAGARDLVGVALGELGLIRYIEGRFDEALTQYDAQRAFLSNDPEVLAAYHARIGGIYHDRGALLAARAQYRRSLTFARSAKSRRRETIALSALGIARWEEGDLVRARQLHRRALALAHAHGDDPYEGICLATLGGIEASSGRLARAEHLLERARRVLSPRTDGLAIRAIDLYEAMLLFARSERLAKADPTSSAELRTRARARIVPFAGTDRVGDDVRVALRILRARFGEDLETSRGRGRLVVHARGDWFVAPGSGVVRLAGKPLLASLLAVLAGQRVTAPGKALDTFALVEAGWPGEDVRALAGANRVYVAIATLRRLGLRAMLTRTRDGYLVDPSADLTISSDAIPRDVG